MSAGHKKSNPENIFSASERGLKVEKLFFSHWNQFPRVENFSSVLGTHSHDQKILFQCWELEPEVEKLFLGDRNQFPWTKTSFSSVGTCSEEQKGVFGTWIRGRSLKKTPRAFVQASRTIWRLRFGGSGEWGIRGRIVLPGTRTFSNRKVSP